MGQYDEVLEEERGPIDSIIFKNRMLIHYFHNDNPFQTKFTR